MKTLFIALLIALSVFGATAAYAGSDCNCAPCNCEQGQCSCEKCKK
jgi:hypothetical protein